MLVQLWFASLSVVAKAVLRELEPRGLIAVRTTLAALAFLGVWAGQGRQRVRARDLGRITVPCRFEAWFGARPYRCLPDAARLSDAYFEDAACTRPLAEEWPRERHR